MGYLRIISSHLSRSVKSLPRNCSSNPLPRENPNQLFTVQASKYASSAQQSRTPPSEKVSSIVDEITGLTLLEVMELTEVLRQKLDISEMPTMAVMMPGMGSPAKGAGKGGASGPGKGEEKKEEKTVFDVNLEGFDAAAKIKVIKEVRGFTDLGLKEAKDLVEKAPTLLKKGVTKEEAEKIIQKMKDAGAKVAME